MDLETLIFQMLQGSKEAENKLIQMKDEKQSLPIFLNFINSTSNPILRQFSAVMIFRMVKMYIDEMDLQFQGQIYEFFIKLIPNEEKMETRYTMCDIAIEMRLDPTYKSSLLLLPFAMNLLQTNNGMLISTGLYIFHNIFEYLPDEQKEPVADNLFMVAVQCIGSEDYQCRIQAMNVLVDISFPEPYTNMFYNNDYMDMVVMLTKKITEHPVEIEETGKILDLANAAVKSILENFVDKVPVLSELIVSIISNTNIDQAIRINATETLSCLIEYAFELIEPFKNDILSQCVAFSIELSNTMPESEDYSFISNIIQEISRYSESSSIFDFLFEMIINILKSNGIMETRVAFIILANLIEIYEENTEDNIQQIVSMIKDGLMKNDNIFIPEAAAMALSALCKYCEVPPEELLIEVDNIIPLLFQNIGIIKCMHAISHLLSITNDPPKNIIHYIQYIISIMPNFSGDMQENLIIILNSFLESICDPDESIFSLVEPVIHALLRGEIIQKSYAIQCFGKLINICPKSTHQYINDYIKNALCLITPDNYEAASSGLEFFENVINSQSIFLTDYINQLFQLIINILTTAQPNYTESDDNDEDEEEAERKQFEAIRVFESLISNSLRFLAQICSTFPRQIEPNLETVYNILIKKMSDVSDDVVQSSIEAFDNLSEAYIDLGYDVSILLETIFQQIQGGNANSLEQLAILWKTAAVIIGNAGKNSIMKFVDDIAKILLNVFSHKINIYNNKGDNTEFNDSLRNPIFFALETFINELGPDFSKYAPSFLPILHKIASCQNSKSQAYASLLLAEIGSFLPDSPESESIINTAIQIALNSISSSKKSNSKKIKSFSILTVVTDSKPQYLQAQAQDLLQLCENNFHCIMAGQPIIPEIINGTFTLWSSLVRQFHIQTVSLETIANIFNIIQINQESTDLIYAAKFVLYCAQFREQLNQIFLHLSVSVFSSSRFILSKLNNETKAFMVSVIETNDPQNIEHVLRYNQTLMQKIKNNISLYKQSQM